MNVAGLLFLIITQFLAGRGIISLFRIKQKPLSQFLLSNIIGIVIFSLIPVLLQLFYIPITIWSVIVAIVILTGLLFIPKAAKLDYLVLKQYKSLKMPQWYEIVFIILFIVIMIPSLWYCYFYPPNTRDVLTGPEPLAEFTIREHTLINSIFSVDLSSTNNHIKPPFIAGLQILYKLLVQPFGQVWLSVIAVSFLIWIYQILREKFHPILAGILMLLFIAMPDPYAYTYIVLFDYSNMVLFFAGLYFLMNYVEARQYNMLLFSAFLFGLATIIRSETVVLVGMLLPLLAYFLWKEKLAFSRAFRLLCIFMLVPSVFYYFWIGVFVKYYFPVSFDVSEQVRLSVSDIPLFFTRLSEMTSTLIFSSLGLKLYGYINYLFLLALIADCIFIRSFNVRARIMLYGIAIVYVCMAFFGYLIPWFDLMNTTKRGLYKMFPLMMVYFCNSGVLAKLSASIWKFEQQAEIEPAVQPVKVSMQSKKKR